MVYYLPRSEEKIFLGIVLVQILVPPLIPESLFFMAYASSPRSCPGPDPGRFLVLILGILVWTSPSYTVAGFDPVLCPGLGLVSWYWSWSLSLK
jgi:hypothetical protein